MKYFILITLSLVYCYEISLSEVQDCVSKNCDTENSNCQSDTTCNQSLQDFNECFTANEHNVTYPYQECKGVSNNIYATLMVCYENCDYNLILYGIKILMNIILYNLL